ncbi:tyrosine-type recombinase/integrase [Actinoallomurus sp. NPDC050550]|uniref:tyrosine-type recombinase/integrase n=1 Tax=Actinoallomurus sp. NPDC050550 TaxID=3154937 RepID=UPI0033C414B6
MSSFSRSCGVPAIPRLCRATRTVPPAWSSRPHARPSTGKAGLGHWHPHELRHSGASLMLAQGTPLHVVSEILGHASITITKDVYGHLMEGDKRAAATSMSRALFGS